jgi:hypothetical protein
VLVVVVGVVQPVSDTRAATAKQERMNFFISIFFRLVYRFTGTGWHHRPGVAIRYNP